MNFTYFAGDESSIYWDSEVNKKPVQKKCATCAKKKKCIWYREPKLEDVQYGCIDCLKERRFKFYHETELGAMQPDYRFLTIEGNPFKVEPLKYIYSELPDGFQRESFDELLYTPPYVRWQQEVWLVHCNDFMVCLGRWKQRDFEEYAEDGDVDALVKSMVAFDWMGKVFIDDDILYIAFRCRHCGTLRGYQDFD